jgi:hypothetical protein
MSLPQPVWTFLYLRKLETEYRVHKITYLLCEMNAVHISVIYFSSISFNSTLPFSCRSPQVAASHQDFRLKFQMHLRSLRFVTLPVFIIVLILSHQSQNWLLLNLFITMLTDAVLSKLHAIKTMFFNPFQFIILIWAHNGEGTRGGAVVEALR